MLWGEGEKSPVGGGGAFVSRAECREERKERECRVEYVVCVSNKSRLMLEAANGIDVRLISFQPAIEKFPSSPSPLALGTVERALACRCKTMWGSRLPRVES